MNQRAIALQFLIFVMQWGLMIIGFGILALIIAPLRLPTDPSLGRYFDAGLKALIALVLSVSWLFIWDRQVRTYFYRKGEPTAEAS
jgi:4-amino-4-deoxy-L-arabinose transferase-like glycosyltransferase